jgi:GTP:adenosylcobinamide-phosphate guanylyltransferase
VIEMLDAAVLASGVCHREFREVAGKPHKCLTEVAGRPMIRWVLDALEAAWPIGRVVVVGPAAPVRQAGALRGRRVLETLRAEPG